MVLAIPQQPSCVRAWLAAAEAIARDGEGYDVVIDVENPTRLDCLDNQTIKLVDTFLRDHKQAPVSTVVNTIFPSSLFRRFGPEAFIAEYHKVYDRLTTKRWGRYFHRMTRRVGRNGKIFSPLEKIIEKLQKQNNARTPYKAAYELPLYDPDLDRNRYRDAPCLSYLSFKRRSDRSLSMTAVYRNHSYITRCLGNLIGLGRLQAFVADQAGLKVGSLTCVSTHAEIDKGDAKEKENKWGLKKARELLREAAEILGGQTVTC